LEVLLVLAIIGLMTGVFIVGVTRLTDDKPATPDEVFWNAVTASRRQALLTAREVRLTYLPADTAEGASRPAGLNATWENKGEQFFPFEKMGDVICEFLTTQKGASAILVGGELVETQTIPHITFYGDGTCTPFRVQFRIGASAYTLAIDPWTCAQMLEQKEDGK
jgi:general secretion pathway protein H